MRRTSTSRCAAAGIALGSLFAPAAARAQASEPISVSSAGVPAQGWSEAAGLSDDGRFALLISSAPNLDPADSNPARDAFVHDRWLGRTEPVSAGSDGASADTGVAPAALSASGRFAVFDTPGGRLAADDRDFERDVSLRDCERGVTELLSTEGGIHLGPALSADARTLAYASAADGSEEFEVVLLERESGHTQRIARTGIFRSAFSSADFAIAVSRDGSAIAVRFAASDLVPGDDLEEFEPPPIVHPNALIRIRMSGALVLVPRKTNPALTLSSRQQLELQLTNEANQAFAALVSEAAIDLDLKEGKLTYSTQLVTRSTTPHAPSTAMGLQVSSHNPTPTLRFELRYPLLDGTAWQFRFLASDVVIPLEVTPRPIGNSRRVPEAEPARILPRTHLPEPVPSAWRDAGQVVTKVALVAAIVIVVGLLIWYFVPVAAASVVAWLVGIGTAAAAAAVLVIRRSLRQNASIPRAPLAAVIQHRASVAAHG